MFDTVRKREREEKKTEKEEEINEEKRALAGDRDRLRITLLPCVTLHSHVALESQFTKRKAQRETHTGERKLGIGTRSRFTFYAEHVTPQCSDTGHTQRDRLAQRVTRLKTR